MADKKHIVVIGAGPAGMMAAITAAEHGARVTLIEKNQKVGRKLYITGKGRCNVTNDCPTQEVIENIPRNSRFMYSALDAWTPRQTMDFFKDLGVELKVERGNRVFPASDRAATIIDALYFRLKSLRVQLVCGMAEQVLQQENRACGVKLTDGKTITSDAVIVATGGVSYPLTGSTGDGYRFAEQAGHTIVGAKPSLVPLVEEGDICRRMQGLALKNVALKIKNQKNKVVFSDFGELLFTHFGLSGPLVLSASAHLKDFDKNHYTAIIDTKPALDEAKLDARLLRDFGENVNRDFQNVLSGLVPRLMVPVVIDRCGIPGDCKVHQITRAQRRVLTEVLKAFSVPLCGTRPVEEAIVTSGGVKVGEINPATMESKKLSGLYFAGEVLDVDAYTGGFNLQIAWSTGRAAGVAAAV